MCRFTVWKKEAAVNTDVSKKQIDGLLCLKNLNICPVDPNYSNIEGEALVIVFVVALTKHFLLGRRYILQSDREQMKKLSTPSEDIPKTAPDKMKRSAIVLMCLSFELIQLLGEQIPHADALSRLDFDGKEFENSRICFANNNNHNVQINLVTRTEIRTKILEDNQKNQLRQISNVSK